MTDVQVDATTTERPTRALARSVFVADLLMVAGDALLLRDAESIPLLIVLLIAVIGWGGIGALIAIRAPRNPIGWLLLVAATAGAFGPLALNYAGWGYAHGQQDLPLADLVGWLSIAVTTPIGVATIPMLFLLYPDGALPSRRWRALVVAIVALIPAIALSGIAVGATEEGLDPPAWAAGSAFVDAFDAIGTILFILCAIGALASLWVRLRRAPTDERGAIRWLLILLATMLGAVTLAVAGGAILAAMGLEAWFALVLAVLVVFPGVLFGIPFAFSIVLLRYGLYDYEVRMRKRIIAASLTGGLTITSLVVIALLSQSFTSGLGADVSVPALLVGAGAVIVTFLLARWYRRFALRVVFGDRATPYEVLSQFSDRIGETFSTDDVLPRMTQLLMASTGAREARVWLRIGDELRSLAAWPPEAPELEPLAAPGSELPSFPEGRIAFPVLHQGQDLGALTLLAAANDPMNPAKERLARDLAAQAGLVLRNVALVEDLRESRRRIVAAQDERARRLERDIHDGAQQQLVALSVKLRLAEGLLERDPARARALMRDLQGEATEALETLRDLARGIYPPLLADQGLGAALTAQGRKATIPVDVSTDGIGRYPRGTEAAVYFSVSEALANVAKYADASRASVALSERHGALRFEVTDDGRGFDPSTAARGTGLQGMIDRLDAIGGTLRIRSAVGEGTSIVGTVPATPGP